MHTKNPKPYTKDAWIRIMDENDKLFPRQIDNVLSLEAYRRMNSDIKRATQKRGQRKNTIVSIPQWAEGSK